MWEMTMKNVLLTGAAGKVGTFLRGELRGRYALRLSDRQPVEDLDAGETFVGGDIGDLDACVRMAEGVDGIIHMGGISSENTWETILHGNIVGCYNMFEAARINGVRRIVFASSNHAMGFYPRDQRISENVTVRPDSRYGVSKAFGEAVGSLYVDKYGLDGVLAIRIGHVGVRPIDRRRLSIWISPRDLAQLVTIGLESPELGFQIVYGVSDNERSWWDNAIAYRLGYNPQDRSEDYAASVLAESPPESGRPAEFQGGSFVEAELGGGAVKPEDR